MADVVEENKGGVAFEVVLDQAKTPASPCVVSKMTASTNTPTREEIEEKLKVAEERRKHAEKERLDKLAQLDKHAEEVRAKKEKSVETSNPEVIEERLNAAEERRKNAEKEKLEKLAQMDKRAEEVRERAEKFKAHPELMPKETNGQVTNGV